MQPLEPSNQPSQEHNPLDVPKPTQTSSLSSEQLSSPPQTSSAAHAPGQVFSPGGQAQSLPNPTPSALPTPPPNLGVGDAQPSSLPVQDSSPSFSPQAIYPEPLVSGSSLEAQEEKTKGPWYKPSNFKPSKKMALILGIPLLLIAGGAGAYFGYIVPNKPENVWRTALTNTGKGYDKLSEYATAKKDTKGMKAEGSFKISGSLAADGSFKGMSDGKNGQLTGNVSAAGLKINYDVRSIESPGNSPDIYFKIDGIQGLGTLVGGYAGALGSEGSQIEKALNGLNGQWYFIDHTLFDQFASGSNDDMQFTSGDVDAVLKAVGDSSKQYLFTNYTEKMAVVVKQYVGKEKQDGRNVYHYKIGVNKENLKAYNKSLCDNLIKTKLFKLFSGGSGDVDYTQQCYDSTGIDKIDDSRTADAWVDLHTKLIHKLRFSEKGHSSNYIDIAQDYQGGDEFPFSLGYHYQSSVDSGAFTQGDSRHDTMTALLNMKLNMKTNSFSADARFENSGYSDDKATFKLVITPTSETAKVGKPAGAKTIIELINDLGFGELVPSSDSSPGATPQSKAKDTERKTDLNALTSQLEVYYADNGYYPTLANLNDSSWRKSNLKGLDDEALKDPEGGQTKLASTPTAKIYSYQTNPANCNNSSSHCDAYTLVATLGDGSIYTKQSLN